MARRDHIARLRSRSADLAQQHASNVVASGGISPSDGGIESVQELRRRQTEALIEQSGYSEPADALAAHLSEAEAELSRIPDQTVEWARLARAQRATEGLMKTLQMRLQKASMAEQSELGYVEVVRVAEVPRCPVAPDRLSIGLLGALAGIGLGVGLVRLRARIDHRLHRPDDLRDRGVILLGTVPDMGDSVRDGFGGAEPVEIGGRQVSTGMAVLLTPLSQASEAYRALRTSIQFSNPDVAVRTVLVTSASPSEGKSTTAANLAVAMARDGRRVLLVDADLRRPRQHALFGVSRTPGVADVLFQPLESGLLSPGWAPSGVDDLDVLAAGAHAPNPSKLLGSRAYRDRLEAWSNQHDLVVIDAPPVLVATDAVLLAMQADATVVVVRAGQTKTFELDRALDALRGVGAAVVGAVFNGFDATHTSGYSYRGEVS